MPLDRITVILTIGARTASTPPVLGALFGDPRQGRDLGAEVLVVGVGASAPFARVMARYADRVQGISLAEATGVAAARNAGVAASSGEFVVFLDEVASPKRGWLSALLRAVEGRPAIAAAGARLLAPDRTIRAAGIAIGQDRLPRPLYAGFPADHPAANRARPMAALAAGGLLVRRALFEAAGGFETGFAGDWSGVDLCLRLGEAGYECWYAPEAIVGSTAPAPGQRLDDDERSLELWTGRWKGRVAPDDLRFYAEDGLLGVDYAALYPVRLGVSPRLAVVDGTEREEEADRLLFERAAQVADLLRENVHLQLRVQELEFRLAELQSHGGAPARPRQSATGVNGAAPVEWSGLAGRLRSVMPARAKPVAAPVPPPHRRIIAVLDNPAPMTRTVVTGDVMVDGWAVSGAGIGRIETLVDGQPRGELRYGISRPDVGSSLPAFADAAQSGFFGVIPAADLPPGEHILVVRVLARDGATTEFAATFESIGGADATTESPHVNAQYADWLRAHTPGAAELGAAFTAAATLTHRPTFSLVVPVTDPATAPVEVVVDAVRAQAYGNWELYLAVADPEAVRPALVRLGAADPRVVVVGPTGSDGPESAVSAAFGRAAGEFVGLLDERGVLTPLALAQAAQALNESPETDLIYGDEDKVDPSGVRWDPFFKPDWSPDLLLSMSYLGPLLLARRSLVEAVGGVRSGIAGGAGYDLALRLTERTDRVRHLPTVLCSLRFDDSPDKAPSPTPPALLDAERCALEAAVARRDLAASIEEGARPGRWRVRYALTERPGVTILLPSGGKLEFLRPCLESVLGESTYPDLRMLVIDNSGGSAVAELLQELSPRFPGLRRIEDPRKPFNYSALMNAAMPLVETPYVILFNDDITVITPDWVEAMLEQAQRPEVGVVGPKLLYPDGTIQHAGVALGPFGLTGHPFRRFPGDYQGNFGLVQVVRNQSAVTFACAMLRRSLFEEAGGLDDANLPVAFNDVDLCLRIRSLGYRIVYTPHAALYHHESVTKPALVAPGEVQLMRRRWLPVIEHDPFYNPNLSRDRLDYSLNLG